MSGCTTAGVASGATRIASSMFESHMLRAAFPDSDPSAWYSCVIVCGSFFSEEATRPRY